AAHIAGHAHDFAVDVLIAPGADAPAQGALVGVHLPGHRLADDNHRIVIIKKGENGALLFYNKYIFSAPAYPMEEIFDPTGAGDTFMGGLIGYLTRWDTIHYATVKRAVVYGSVLASFCCSKFSTEGIEDLSMDQIYRRFRELQSISSFEDEPYKARNADAEGMM
ncbi:MAG: PfkB family carbohydrate kinase, partial [Candidatus Kapaibacterium sp.]